MLNKFTFYLHKKEKYFFLNYIQQLKSQMNNEGTGYQLFAVTCWWLGIDYIKILDSNSPHNQLH